MILSSPYLIFLFGFFGAVLGEILKWYRIRTRKRLPRYAKSSLYWITTALLSMSGGLLAVLYSNGNMNAIVAVNIGISAPLIIESLSRTFVNQTKAQDYTNNRHSSSDIMEYLDESVTRKVLLFLCE